MWALAAASSTTLAGLGPRASCSRRKCSARWRRSAGFERIEGVVSRDLRACLRSAFSISLRVFTTVLRLHFATLARSVVDPSGLALSAASARSRSTGELRF